MSQKIFTYIPEQLEEINRNISGTTKNIQQDLAITSYEINKKVDKIDRKLDSAIKPRKKVSCHFLAQVYGCFYFVTKYDDGSQDICYALDNLSGPFSVSRVYVEDICTEPLYLIEFREEQRYFWGLVNNLTGKKLYEEFVKNGVRFSTSFPQSKINTMLYEFFAPLITNTENKLSLPSHAGFFNGRFVCSETFPCIEMNCLRNLPIKHKSFPQYCMEENTFSIYREALMNFENAQERFCVCAYPFLSMLSSLLNEYGYVFDFSLNFVNLSHVSSLKLCELFQVFNREKIVLNNLSLTPKNLDNILATIKDEVFVVDNTAYEEATDYQKNTNYQKLMHLLAVFNEQRHLPTVNRRVHAGLVTISSSYCLRSNVFNIVFSPKQKTFESNRVVSSHCMERIFYNFITFLENMSDTEKTEFFSKKRNERSNAGRVLSLIFDLLATFWSKYGLNFASELMFPTFDYDTFFDLGEHEDGNEEINKFIAILRKHALNYTIAEKKRSCISDNCILFTEEYVFIPVNIVKGICNNENISREHRRILLEMRKLGLLKTDKNSLSRVVQINNQRHEMYVINRKVLTRPGEIEFIHLGKGGY